MTLPTGTISMSQVASELGISASGLSMNDSRVRSLAGRSSGSISMSHLRGRTRATISVASTSGTGARGAYHYVNYSVAAGCTTSGAWSSGGTGISVSRTSNTQFRFHASGTSVNGATRTGTYRVTATPNGGGIAAAVNRSISVTDALPANCACDCSNF